MGGMALGEVISFTCCQVNYSKISNLFRLVIATRVPSPQVDIYLIQCRLLSLSLPPPPPLSPPTPPPSIYVRCSYIFRL